MTLLSYKESEEEESSEVEDMEGGGEENVSLVVGYVIGVAYHMWVVVMWVMGSHVGHGWSGGACGSCGWSCDRSGACRSCGWSCGWSCDRYGT